MSSPPCILLPGELTVDCIHGVHVQGDLVDSYNFKPSLAFLRTIKGAFTDPGSGCLDFVYAGTIVGSVSWSMYEFRASFPQRPAVFDFVASFVGPWVHASTARPILPELSVVRTSTPKSITMPELCVVVYWEELIVRRQTEFWKSKEDVFPPGGLKLRVRKDQSAFLEDARAVIANILGVGRCGILAQIPTVSPSTVGAIEAFIRERPKQWDRFALDALADLWSACLVLQPVCYEFEAMPASSYPEREQSIQRLMSILRRSNWTDTQARDIFFCFLKV